MNMLPSAFAQRLALASHGVLILAVALRHPSALSLLLATVLCLPLVGLWRGKSYTCAWASMLVAFFVAGYLADGYAKPESRGWAFAIAGVAALDYVSLMMFVRFRATETAAARAQAPVARTVASDDVSR